jgi:DNA polymerase
MRPGLHLDFETYCDLDLKECGMFRYSEHPSAQALILGWARDNDTPQTIDLTAPDAAEKLQAIYDIIASGARVIAHNAQFEWVIWQNVLCRQFKVPISPKPMQWDCTAARARVLALPGALDGAAHALKVPNRKDPRGEELIKIFCKPNPKTGKRTFPYERPEDFQAFREYCGQDVVVEQELDRILPPLPGVEAEAFALDFKINALGMPVNVDRVNAAHGFVEEYSATLQKRAFDIAGCRPTQREKTLEFLETRGHHLPNLQAPTVEALAARPGLDADLVELLDHRIELSRAGTKKLTAIKACVSEDGRVRGGFMFSAASTRRWSSVGVQMHNLQKPEGEANPQVALSLLDDSPQDLCLMFGRPLTVLAQSIRGFFESPEHFLVADYASVEPRGLGWSADEEWLLKAYRNKEDAYKIAAGRVYSVRPDQVNSAQRFMGKQLVLGCGYGMGWEKFVATCAKFGRVLTEDEAKEAVYGYRASVPQITKFWRQVEQACIRAVSKWTIVKCGRFTFRPEILANGFKILYIDMPSGTIAYPKPFLKDEATPWGDIRATFNFWTPWKSSWVATDTFGGSLVENIIQALTRDILRDGMLAADKAGFKISGHCHDEAIGEGANNKNDLAEFERLLCTSSEWAEDFPIVTEGYISQVYKK